MLNGIYEALLPTDMELDTPMCKVTDDEVRLLIHKHVAGYDNVTIPIILVLSQPGIGDEVDVILIDNRPYVADFNIAIYEGLEHDKIKADTLKAIASSGHDERQVDTLAALHAKIAAISTTNPVISTDEVFIEETTVRCTAIVKVGDWDKIFKDNSERYMVSVALEFFPVRRGNNLDMIVGDQGYKLALSYPDFYSKKQQNTATVVIKTHLKNTISDEWPEIVQILPIEKGDEDAV